MRGVEEHLAEVLGLVAPTEVCSVPLGEALGCAVAGDVRAAIDLPPFDNSAMDGYAVRAADAVAGAALPVTDEVAAGRRDVLPLGPATAQRIMTGAPVPPGADAVIQVEWTDDGAEAVRLDRGVELGANIRRTGEDVRAGDLVVAGGDEVTPGVVGLLAALGQLTVSTHRRPRVGVLSTGSELAPPGSQLAPGQVHDANAPMLAACLHAAGAVPVLLGAVVDSPELLLSTIRAEAGLDLLVTSGGISAGTYEVVKEALSGKVSFVKVAMQPGMPQGLGRLDDLPVVALPGNPVSAAVSFEVFVRPAVRRLLGLSEVLRPVTRGVLAEPVARRPDRRQYRRASFDPATGRVALQGGVGSHLVAALALSNCLLLVPEGEGVLAEGTEVDLLVLHG